MQRTNHILPAASNLLGITLIIIAGLHVSRTSARTFADEVAWGGAIAFSLSCVGSYVSLRSVTDSIRAEILADIAFMIGLVLLLLSIVVLGLSQA